MAVSFLAVPDRAVVRDGAGGCERLSVSVYLTGRNLLESAALPCTTHVGVLILLVLGLVSSDLEVWSLMPSCSGEKLMVSDA